MQLPVHDIKIHLPEQEVDVSGLVLRPENARSMLVIGHGAGAGMTHAFLDSLTQLLAAADVASLRYNFPYKEHGGKRPDRTRVLTDTVKAAVSAAREHAGALPLFAGGKSMGGRMTSLQLAEDGLEGVQGLVFFGFPLHPPGKPGKTRADHLAQVHTPMLFLQGSRDRLADIGLMRNVVTDLGSFATLHVIEDADHSFAMLKRSGRSNADALAELATQAGQWIDSQLDQPPA
ncbi:MAG: dienelactone hydrolase family protein [Gammaproteobacteria bacterium]|nr:dienelactone hydrolase family protein [Gammaproteobacteria bacterium]NNF61868.1 alpha/beta hydrolase [Gammaproteobacteria bacterium]NNM19664.1 alpha/beta hydrolase [Gammaproteobacteria bacterium]